MVRTIIYIHCDDEDDNVGHHEGGDQPWEPALEEAEVAIVHGRGTRRRRRVPPPPSGVDGGGVAARMNLHLDGGRRWVPPHDSSRPFGKD